MTYLLTIGVVLAVTIAFVALVLVMRPPLDPPVTAYEVARLLRGIPIVTVQSGITVRTEQSAPAATASHDSRLIRGIIAQYLHRPPTDVVFDSVPLQIQPPDWNMNSGTKKNETFVGRQYRLYRGDDQFNPPIFESFVAGLRQPDGSWRTLQRTKSSPFYQWQFAMIRLILMVALLVAPIVWLFSRRMAEPIRLFG
ncbi:MAG: hypothetical protein M3N02_09040, partial [Pseudomonadota bacterium]|nr:hypothetical protein [Pseudomonadota bacterium]